MKKDTIYKIILTILQNQKIQLINFLNKSEILPSFFLIVQRIMLPLASEQWELFEYSLTDKKKKR